MQPVSINDGTLPKRCVEEAGTGAVELLCGKAAEVELPAICAPAVVANAIKVPESSAVRTLYALHVGCSLQWNAELFVSSDDLDCRENPADSPLSVQGNTKRANLRTK